MQQIYTENTQNIQNIFLSNQVQNKLQKDLDFKNKYVTIIINKYYYLIKHPYKFVIRFWIHSILDKKLSPILEDINQQKMASIIKDLVLLYKKRAVEQSQGIISSQAKLHEVSMPKRNGQLFLQLIANMLINEGGISQTKQKPIEYHKSKLLQKINEKHKLQGGVIQQVFGEFIMQLIKKDEKLSGIYRELDLLFQIDQPNQEIFDFDSIQIQEVEQDNHSSFFTLCNQLQISSIYEQKSFHKRVEEQSFTAFNQAQHQTDKSHEGIVNQFVSKLSSPQTELTYLCHHFGWKGSFKDSVQTNGSFIVTAKIEFQYKNIKKDLFAKAEYKSKKLARLLAAAKILRSLYISYPQIWNIYSKIKNQKSLVIPENDMNSKLIKQAIKEEKVQIPTIKNSESEDCTVKLKKYLAQITNFKTELSVLLQQITGVFTHPKMQKIANKGKWRVKGQLQVKNKQTGIIKNYVEVEESQNSKEAEEAIAKRLLCTMYAQNKEILQYMIMIKVKKGIKT